MMDEAHSSEVVNVLVGSHRRFLDFVSRRVGDPATAEDILQEAFVRGIDRADQVRDGESAVAWFYRLLRNAVIDHYRRQASARRRDDAIERELGMAEAFDEEAAGEICACVRELAGTLEPSYAEALRRVDVDGLAVNAFAAEAGISANNAGVRLHRARAALRERVRQSCGTCATHGCLDCSCGAGHSGHAGHAGHSGHDGAR